eukprot:10397884-Alexandrium_andersonii.AAC.1
MGEAAHPRPQGNETGHEMLSAGAPAQARNLLRSGGARSYRSAPRAPGPRSRWHPPPRGRHPRRSPAQLARTAHARDAA